MMRFHHRLVRIQECLVAIGWRSLIAFVLPLVLYLRTLAPTIGNLDSAELTTAAATLGLTRATGYPLYILLGHLWAQLPLGDVGYRLNLFSAFNGALTIALAERILRRLQVGPWAAFGAVGLLATAPFFWGLSLVAEVYTLHTALMAAIILLWLHWAERPSPAYLGWIGFGIGLSLGNHMATILLLPGCAWFGLAAAPRKLLNWRAMTCGALGLATGLAIYLYLPLRYAAHPTFNYAGHYGANGIFYPLNLKTWHDFWWLVSARGFSGLMFTYQAYNWAIEIWHFVSSLWRAFFAIGIGPGLLGLVILLRRNKATGGMTLCMFLANAIFYSGYRVIDKDTMYLPAYLIFALWIGVGYQALLNWLRPASSGNAQTPTAFRWQAAGIKAVLMIAVVLVTLWNWPYVDLSSDRSARQQGEAILDQVEPGALVLGWWDVVPVIQYLQLVEKKRPDIDAVNRFLISPENLYILVSQETQHRPVYIDDPTEALWQEYKVVPTGPVYRLLPKN